MDIYSDGGARGNPGPGACGFVVIDKGKAIHKGNRFLGIVTNNQAEYWGVVLALEWLSKNNQGLSSEVINFYLDSELICRQIKGQYKVKDVKLKILKSKVDELIKSMSREISFQNVPREKNKLADFLVNKSLDENIS